MIILHLDFKYKRALKKYKLFDKSSPCFNQRIRKICFVIFHEMNAVKLLYNSLLVFGRRYLYYSKEKFW